jgi:hypothetical protein
LAWLIFRSVERCSRITLSKAPLRLRSSKISLLRSFSSFTTKYLPLSSSPLVCSACFGSACTADATASSKVKAHSPIEERCRIMRHS